MAWKAGLGWKSPSPPCSSTAWSTPNFASIQLGKWWKLSMPPRVQLSECTNTGCWRNALLLSAASGLSTYKPVQAALTCAVRSLRQLRASQSRTVLLPFLRSDCNLLNLQGQAQAYAKEHQLRLATIKSFSNCSGQNHHHRGCLSSCSNWTKFNCKQAKPDTAA